MQLAGGLAEQRAHSRADVGDAVLAIDLPQPADAALLIFLEQQARAFALAADVGVGLELVERPAGDGQDAEDRHAEREQRSTACAGTERVWRPSRSAPPTPPVKAIIQALAQGGMTTRPSAADAEAGHDRGGDDLRCRDRATGNR